MVRRSFMVIAGELSGDLLAAELVRALREEVIAREALPTDDRQPLQASLEPRFFGAGGPNLQAAGVSLAVDMTQHSVVGLWEVVKRYGEFRRIFHQLRRLAIQQAPDVIICVDFGGFNLRFGHAVRQYVRSLRGTFGNWKPLLVQCVSPQVWASRPERAERLARDFDLLLSILPFEQAWYAQRAPRLAVEFVGHPIVDRYVGRVRSSAPSSLLLLPGSRVGEIQRHLPVMLEALRQVHAKKPMPARMVLPNEALAQLAREYRLPPDLELQVGEVGRALADAQVAIASTGTVTLECAYFEVPTVALYKTSSATYWVARQLVQVKYLSMPNLMAGEEVFPEFIQGAATPENLSRATLALLEDPERQRQVAVKLAEIAATLGAPGASRRAARAIVQRLEAVAKPLRASLSRAA